MKKHIRLFLVLVAVLVVAPVGAQDAAARAEGAYRAGDYVAAERAWQELLETRPGGDARIEYNLGNCAYRQGEFARALWRYERAARVLGDDEALRFNLALTRRRLGLGADETEGFLAGVRDRLAGFTAEDWLWLGLVFELPGLLLLGYGAWRRRRGLALVGVLFAILGTGLGLRGAWTGGAEDRRGIVLERRTPIRAEPREALEPRARLGAGVSVRVLELGPQWARVEARGVRGWTPRTGLGLY